MLPQPPPLHPGTGAGFFTGRDILSSRDRAAISGATVKAAFVVMIAAAAATRRSSTMSRYARVITQKLDVTGTIEV